MTAKKPAPIEFRENLFAPEVFADIAAHFSLGPGILKITLCSTRADVSAGQSNSVVIGRLVMPVSGAQSLAAGLYDFLKSHGLDPNPTPTDPKHLQ